MEESIRGKVSPQELERMWKGIDLACFWARVIEGASEGIEAYSRARALSKGKAVDQVFI
jgi:hypothetical protein